MQRHDQKTIAVIMRERRFLDGAGKLDCLLKATVSDLHLLIAVSLFEKRISTATANA